MNKLRSGCAAALLLLLAACAQHSPTATPQNSSSLYARATSETTVEVNLPSDLQWNGQPYPESYKIDPGLGISSVDLSRASSGVVTLTTAPQTDETYTLTVYPEPETVDSGPIGNLLTTTFKGGGQDDGDYSPIIPETTEVLSSGDRASVTSYTGSSLRLASGSSLAGRVRVGDVLVSEPIPGVAPYGFLRKVTAVSGTTLSLTEAALEEAVEQGELVEAFTLSTSDIVSSTPGNNVLIEEGTLSAQGIDLINVSFVNEVVCETNGDKITLNGSLKASLSPFIDAKIRLFKGSYFEARVDVEESANVKLSGKCGKEFKKEKLLEEIKFKTFVFTIGPVPVVVTPTVKLYIGAKGELSVEVEFEATQEFSGSYGVKYDRGWQVVNVTDHGYDYTPPSIKGEVKARGYVGAKAGLMFYGTAFVYTYPQAYVEAKAEVSIGSSSLGSPAAAMTVLAPSEEVSLTSLAEYSFCIYAGIDINVGAELDFFNKTKSYETKRLNIVKKELYCAKSKGPDPKPKPPAPTSSDLTCIDAGSQVDCTISYTASPITTTSWSAVGGTLYYGTPTAAYFGCGSGGYISVQATVTYDGGRTSTISTGTRCM